MTSLTRGEENLSVLLGGVSYWYNLHVIIECNRKQDHLSDEENDDSSKRKVRV